MKKRGKGIATIGYSTGFYGGGDPDEAQISLKTGGSGDTHPQAHMSQTR